MNDAYPKISVVMAVHNGERFLHEAVESVLAQTFTGFEFVIVDDGSADKTATILDSFTDKRIVRLVNKKNCGLAASLNLGIAEARGEYIARMDADDVSQPDRLEKQIEYMSAHPDTVLLGTAYEEIDAGGRVVGFGDPPLRDDDLQYGLMSQNRFCHGSVIMSTAALEAVGGYDEDFERSQDYDLWLRLAEYGAVANLPEYLYRWRQHGGRVSVTQSETQAAHALRAQQTAWHRRASSFRLARHEHLLAWARAAVRERRLLAVAMLLLKSVLRKPWSLAPWRLAFGRLLWAAAGVLGMGKAAAIRNEKRIQYEIANGETFLKSHPSHLTWLMIDKCNCKCVMCGGGYFEHTSGRRLTTEKCKKILNHLKPKLLTSVMFGGAGEPLLNPDFSAIAKLTRQRCPEADLMLITNGIALNTDAIATLVQYRINALVSINAATAETYRRVGQVDEFDTVCRNVRALTRTAKSAGSDLRVTLSLIGMERNIAELPEFVRLAGKLGASEVLMNYCRFYPEYCRYKSFDDPKNRLGEEESLFFHQSQTDTMVVEARRLAATLGIRFENESLFAADERKEKCTYPWRVLFAGFDGEVYWCPEGEVLFEHSLADGVYAAGNLLDAPIEAIWNNPFFIRIRAGLYGSGEPLIECQRCGNRLQWLGPCERGCHILDWEGVYRRPTDAVSPKGSE